MRPLGIAHADIDQGKVALDRADLVKRLFAVSLSVGLASRIAKMSWLLDGRIPSALELKDLVLLTLSTVVMVLSWDGYLAALQKFALKDAKRFYLDIFIVVLYLVLLSCSHYATLSFWEGIVATIFFSYLIWDILTKITYPGANSGITATVVWTLYFVAVIGELSNSVSNFVLITLVIFYGMLLYRIDKFVVLNRWLRLVLAAAPFIAVCGIRKAIYL